jgi:alanyl-tRNA synthetase
MNRKGGGSKDMGLEAEQTAWLINKNIATTDTSVKYSNDVKLNTSVLALFTGRGGQASGFVDTVSVTDGVVGIILGASPFYYESGGQIYDTGKLIVAGIEFLVTNVQTYAGYVVHVGTFASTQQLQVGDVVECHVDYARRALIAPNHTMTHVLNYALRTVLLDGAANAQGMCEQKGSLVDQEKLRFDFSWNGALSSEQVERVEFIVNEKIKAGLNVYAQVVPLSLASNISGLRCVFGEKYPDPVRVISVGVSVEELLENPSNSIWSTNSIEFCGGTHLSNTSLAEDFVLFEESGIAKGIRRIQGYTRQGAVTARAVAADLLRRLTEMEATSAGPDLLALNKTIRMEVDQAIVSLVQKDEMRRKLSNVADALKIWSKAQEAYQAVAATETIKKLALEALANNKVICIITDHMPCPAVFYLFVYTVYYHHTPRIRPRWEDSEEDPRGSQKHS